MELGVTVAVSVAEAVGVGGEVVVVVVVVVVAVAVKVAAVVVVVVALAVAVAVAVAVLVEVIGLVVRKASHFPTSHSSLASPFRVLGSDHQRLLFGFRVAHPTSPSATTISFLGSGFRV